MCGQMEATSTVEGHPRSEVIDSTEGDSLPIAWVDHAPLTGMSTFNTTLAMALNAISSKAAIASENTARFTRVLFMDFSPLKRSC